VHTTEVGLNGESMTDDTAYQLVIDSQTLVPGGLITIGTNSLLSLDAAASIVVINGLSTVTLEHKAPNPAIGASGDMYLRTDLQAVAGGLATTSRSDKVAVLGGTTTVVPALSARPVNITLTVGGETIKLPSGQTKVFGGTETVVSALATPGQAAVTIVYGGITAQLANGYITVLGGATTIITTTSTNTAAISATEQAPNWVYQQASMTGQSVSGTGGPKDDSRPVESGRTTGPESNGSQLYVNWGLMLYVFILQNFL
jgi:hypothetical protein